MSFTDATLPNMIAALEARIAELRREIARHPLARELAILAETVDKLRQLPNAVKTETESPSLPLSLPQSADAPGTILGSAEMVVSSAGEPLSTRAILAELPRFGVMVGGKDPIRNLSSILSKRSKRLRSIGHRKNARWWLTDRPLPTELLEEAAE